MKIGTVDGNFRHFRVEFDRQFRYALSRRCNMRTSVTLLLTSNICAYICLPMHQATVTESSCGMLWMASNRCFLKALLSLIKSGSHKFFQLLPHLIFIEGQKNIMDRLDSRNFWWTSVESGLHRSKSTVHFTGAFASNEIRHNDESLRVMPISFIATHSLACGKYHRSCQASLFYDEFTITSKLASLHWVISKLLKR